jgi:hypothetical protein
VLPVIAGTGNRDEMTPEKQRSTRDGTGRNRQAEAIGVLRSAVVEPAELERGSWRYRVHVRRTYVVAAFGSDVAAVVVTAWRVGR